MEPKAFLLRLDPDLHEALRGLAHITRRSMNDIAGQALQEYLVGTGRREFVEASANRTQEDFEVLLDKLAN